MIAGEGMASLHMKDFNYLRSPTNLTVAAPMLNTVMSIALVMLTSKIMQGETNTVQRLPTTTKRTDFSFKLCFCHIEDSNVPSFNL